MSAAEQRKLLEALMGKEALGGAPDTIKYNSPRVCRNYLCGICPHELFTNTKMDIGPCPKIHSEKLLEDYSKARAAGETYGYEDELHRSLNESVMECDRKIQAAQKRLDKASEDLKTAQLTTELADLREEIHTLTKSVEKLAEGGKIGESMKIMKLIEELSNLKNEKHRDLKAIIGMEANSQQQKLRVCDACSAYLSIFDSDKRLADHFAGKMHLGFVKIREKLADLRKKGYPLNRNERGRVGTRDETKRPGGNSMHRVDYAKERDPRPRDRRDRARGSWGEGKYKHEDRYRRKGYNTHEK